MSQRNNHTDFGRVPSFHPRPTGRIIARLDQRCSTFRSDSFTPNKIICVTGIIVPSYDIEYVNQLASKLVDAHAHTNAFVLLVPEKAPPGMPPSPRINRRVINCFGAATTNCGSNEITQTN